jgi:hypothetical protein
LKTGYTGVEEFVTGGGIAGVEGKVGGEEKVDGEEKADVKETGDSSSSKQSRPEEKLNSDSGGESQENHLQAGEDHVYAHKLEKATEVSMVEVSSAEKKMQKESSNSGVSPKGDPPTESFGWFCHMTIVRLENPPRESENTDPENTDQRPGCLIYSPVLGASDSLDSIKDFLEKSDLLPVRIVLSPTPQHHLAILQYQLMFPGAFYLCGEASGQMPHLAKKRRDLRFDGMLSCGRDGQYLGAFKAVSGNAGSSSAVSGISTIPPSWQPAPLVTPLISADGNSRVTLVKPTNRSFFRELNDLTSISSDENCESNSSDKKCNSYNHADPYASNYSVPDTWELLRHNFEIAIIDDNRTGEIVLLHKKSKILIISDLLYKSSAEIVGPGGVKHNYTYPEWFARGQEELFYRDSPAEGVFSVDRAKESKSKDITELSKEDNDYCKDTRTAPPISALLPSYRTHPRMRTIDIVGMKKSLNHILQSWEFTKCLACHTDPIPGDDARRLIKAAWGWVWGGEAASDNDCGVSGTAGDENDNHNVVGPRGGA